MSEDHHPDQPLSPVYARAEASRPQVEQPSSPWTMVLGVAGAVAIGVMVFSTLSHSRAAHAQPTAIKAPDRPAPKWAAGLTTLLAQNTVHPQNPKTPQELRVFLKVLMKIKRIIKIFNLFPVLTMSLHVSVKRYMRYQSAIFVANIYLFVIGIYIWLIDFQ